MPSGEYSVYLSTSDDYVGITKDFGRRSKEHFRKSERTITEMVSGVDKNSARIIEQAVIDYVGRKVNGTGTLANLINSISPSSQLYQEVLKFII